MEIRRLQNQDLLMPELSADIEVVEIGMDEWRVGRAGQLLVTTSASTCILLAAYNQSTQEGIVGHFNDTAGILSEDKKYMEAVTAIEELGNPETTHIWFGGGSFSPMVEIKQVQSDRDFASSALLELFSQLDGVWPDVETQWGDPDEEMDVSLDCATGKLYVKSSPRIKILRDGNIADM